MMSKEITGDLNCEGHFDEYRNLIGIDFSIDPEVTIVAMSTEFYFDLNADFDNVEIVDENTMRLGSINLQKMPKSDHLTLYYKVLSNGKD